MLPKRLALTLLPLLLVTLVQAQAAAPPEATPTAEGLVVMESPRSVAETQAQLEAALEANGFIVVAIVDHAQNAAEAGLELRPTRVILFGNPEAGTPLMQSAQTVAIDLPQKMLLWEDEDGRVFVAYNDPVYLAERHGLSGMDEMLGNIRNALDSLAAAATAP
jgi:uncharacterized protein (DUF302 family)